MDFNKFKSYFTPEDWSKLQQEIKHRYDLIKNEGLPNSADYAKLYLQNLSNAENPYFFLLTATSMVKPITADGEYWYDVSKNLGEPKPPMNESFLKMQKLAGVITEGQYKNKLSEIIGDIDDTPHPDGDFDPMDYADDNNDKIPLSPEVKDFIDTRMDMVKSTSSPEEWEKLSTVEYWQSDFPDDILMQFEEEYPDAYRLSPEVDDYISSKV